MRFFSGWGNEGDKGLVNKKYQIIYADPPYDFGNWSSIEDEKLARKCGRMMYPTMKLEEICKLPIPSIADKDCILFLWVPESCIEQGFAIIKAWGFIYKTFGFTWVKMNKNGWGYYSGLGNWTLGNPEPCLLATHKTFPKRQKAVRELVVSPLMEHSHKPSIVRERIVEMMGDLPRIELFARRKVEGWDCWGNEVGSDIELELKQDG